jgi:hypothetical protein
MSSIETADETAGGYASILADWVAGGWRNTEENADR